MAFVITGINLIEMNLRQIAVEISTQDFSTRIEAVAAEAVLDLSGIDRAMVQLKPATSFVAALIAVDIDEFLAKFRRGEQISVGAGQGFGCELNGPLT